MFIPMIKPNRLRAGDHVAIVSLSWGGLGDAKFKHIYELARRRLYDEFGLIAEPMTHALMGSEFVAAHPEKRARDLNEAFANDYYKAVFAAIGGDDTIRILPYVDFDVIHDNPKIFMGYSDTTINHFMLHKAGLVSFYGPSVMCEFGEYVKLNDYTASAVRSVLFSDTNGYKIEPSGYWAPDHVEWDVKNINVPTRYIPDPRGYEQISGDRDAVVRGRLLGGCVDVFMMAAGTEIWPGFDDWRGAILMLETSEDKPSPTFVKYALRNLAAMGILSVVSAIIVGKPQGEVYYDEYKRVFIDVVAVEEGLTRLPIICNFNLGHAAPIGVFPLGVTSLLDCRSLTLTLAESATK